jgi:hypothetical protein
LRASRGMGAVMPNKMPGKKVIHRKDNPDDVDMYAKGGKVSGKGGKGVVVTKGGTASAMAKKLLQKPGSLTAADMYKEGGKVSKVNQAGNYTKPGMRKSLFESIKASATHGTGAGKWSGRKAQLLAKKYKTAGGGFK